MNKSAVTPKFQLDSGWAWMCCLGCFLQCLLHIGSVVKCFGIMNVAFMEAFGSPAGSAGWILVLYNFTSYGGACLGNALALRFTSRVIVTIGGLVLSLGYISSMFTTNILQLTFTYGLILGIGGAMTFTVSISHVGQYFEKRRALASGLALSGVGIGNFIFPPINRLLLDQFGLRQTLLIFAGIILNVCVAGMLLRPLQPLTITSNDKNADSQKRKQSLCRNIVSAYSLLEWSLLKNILFLISGVTMTFFAAAYVSYFVAIPAHIEQVGYSKSDAALVISLSGLGEFGGRLLFGILADYHFVETRTLIAILLAVATLSAAATPFVTNVFAIGTLTVLFAAFGGPIWALNPVLLAETFGAPKLQSSLGINGMFYAIGTIFSTPVGGTLRDVTGDWKASMYYAAATMCLASCTIITPKIFQSKANREELNVPP